jgi:spermidine synthase
MSDPTALAAPASAASAPAPAAASPAPTGPTAPRGARVQWLTTAFITGCVIMSLELTAFRLYAPYFGYSTYVWGSMIGVVMIALSAGYALGGWLADRSRGDAPLYAVILASGAYQAAVLATVTPVMQRLARLSTTVGPLVATLVIFTPPMTALAITGPYATRLLARSGHIGATAGNVNAVSTVGSILGVFGTSFALVPLFGTRATLITCCVLSSALGALGLALRRSRALALALIPAALLPFGRPLGWTTNAIWVRESGYNLVRVVRGHSGDVMLVLNEEHAVQTVRPSGGGWTGRYFDYFAVGPMLAQGQRVVVLGMGAGASVTATRRAAPDADITAIEIDPEVVIAARRFFGLPPDGPRFHVQVADARAWLQTDRGTYDVVQMDLFQGGLYAPFYLLTEEAFRLVRARMPDGGVMMANIYDGSRARRLLHPVVATLRRVFPSVLQIPIGRRNVLVLAFATPRSLAQVRDTLRNAQVDRDLAEVADEAAGWLAEVHEPPGTMAFTDDHAPVEERTREMLAEAGRR